MNYFAVGRKGTKVVLVKAKALIKAKRAAKRLSVHGYVMVGPVATDLPEADFWSGHAKREKFTVEELN